MNRLINYLKDTFAEIKHVSWPTHTQSIVYTALVIVLSALVAAYLGFFDTILAKILEWLIS